MTAQRADGGVGSTSASVGLEPHPSPPTRTGPFRPTVLRPDLPAGVGGKLVTGDRLVPTPAINNQEERIWLAKPYETRRLR